MTINDAMVIAELTELAERYEAALMANDLSALDAMFWQSPNVVRLGAGENLYGIEQITAFRAKRPGGSPQRSILRTSIACFGRDAGVINLEFRRVGMATIGRQSQIWIRFEEGWRITSAHVSLMTNGH